VAFYGAEQDHDALVTAWDRDSAVLAAFRASDRKLLADIADAVRNGRLAVVDGREVGPILVLADRVPADRFCQASVEVANVLSFDDDDDGGIVYAEHRPTDLERCVAPGPLR
jgi:hypothetical protein